MSSYIVLARKWRPSQFSDVVGQSHIVHTLTNAIEGQRLHQAYLFAGSSGIGKTTIARIFAKVLRCPQRQIQNTSPTQAPVIQSCNQCSSCIEISQGKGVDVIEIDGASNNGVDAVREIRENAKFLPSSGQHKIYIIDEVHMLTTAAFNALLKTLEEPPPHVIFIFATTEAHKIPATILARCQRFDFRRVNGQQILQRLQFVTEQEKIEYEAGALELIAQAAEGSMRDALSLLDQVIAYSGQRLSQNSTREAIGLIESHVLQEILKSVLSAQALPALDLIQQAYGSGHDLRILAKGLLEGLHQVILAKVGQKQVPSFALEMAPLRPLEELEMIFQVFHYGMDNIARSPHPKMVLDILIIKCACAEALAPISQMQSPSNAKPATATSVNSNVTQIPTPAPKQSSSVNSAESAPAVPPARKQSWEGLVAFVRQQRPFLASLLEHASGGQYNDSELRIHFNPRHAFKREQVQSPSSHKLLQELADTYFQRRLKIFTEVEEGAGVSLAQKREEEKQEREHSLRQQVTDHPVIREARSLFGAELGPIELNQDSAVEASQSS